VVIKKIVTVLNGFIHDFATGYWVATIIAITLLNSFQGNNAPVAGLLNKIEQVFFWNNLGALVAIMATGGARTFTYVDNFFGVETEKTRRKMLMTKHILFFVVFGTGAYLAYRMTFL
jgi:putative copper export protein